MSGPPPAATDEASPLGADEFAGLLDSLAPFEAAPRLAVAASGGPDSTALALLAHAWAGTRRGSILALVVDHRLRPESAAETVATVRRLARRGIPARVLVWEGRKPAAGVQAAARAARYRLIEDACREEGILHLLLGHHREDQAETVAMRAASYSAAAGLAGMPAVSEVAGLRLLRPLLAVPGSRLVATLRAAGESWTVDPSNAAPRFRRANLRQDPGFDPGAWWEEGLARAAARADADLWLAAWLARHARPHPFGFARLDRAAWSSLGPHPRCQVLGQLLAAAGGLAYPVRGAVLGRLAAVLLDAPAGSRRTAGGCIVGVRRAELVVAREPGRACERALLQPGAWRVWDGRFAVGFHGCPRPLAVARLGGPGEPVLAGIRERLREAGVPAAAVAALPALRDGDELVACPPLAPYGLRPRQGVFAEAVPRPPWALAGAAFGGVNVVSKGQRLIYRPGTGGDPAAGTVQADPR
ncbi:MAG TPA: tRNA lysidine(34) synthetase TilS [Geminicoccaceae bacterium]|nr:tRNA lysidine(34) synthetase TilS [Geminicoccaceae bacterium]